MKGSAGLRAICGLGLACLLAVGCSRPPDAGAGPGAPAGAAPPASGSAEASERAWVGLLPCSDCQGVDTRLVLRVDAGRRSYLMTETYLGGSGENSFKRSGAWTEQTAPVGGESMVVYILDPEQPGQRFALQPDGALELLEADGREPAQAVAYRLQRQ